MTASSIGTYLDLMSADSARQSEAPASQSAAPSPSADIAVAAQVLALVMAGKATVEEIATAAGIDPGEALAALVSLSSAGVVLLSVNGAEVRATPTESITAITDE